MPLDACHLKCISNNYCWAAIGEYQRWAEAHVFLRVNKLDDDTVFAFKRTADAMTSLRGSMQRLNTIRVLTSTANTVAFC